MSPFNSAHATSYATLIETMRLSCTVFEIYPVICRKSPILTNPPEFGGSVGVDPGRISLRSLAFGIRTLSSLSYLVLFA